MIRSTHSIPEVRSLTARRRNVLTNGAGNTWLHNLHFVATLVLVFGLPPVAMLIAFRWVLPSLIVSLITALVYFPVGAMLLRPRLRQIMVNRRGRPFVCFQCGYRLLGLREARCPECGLPAEAPPAGRLRRPAPRKR